MKPEHKDAVVSARVALAVNKRFHSYEKGLQVGVASGTTTNMSSRQSIPVTRKIWNATWKWFAPC